MFFVQPVSDFTASRRAAIVAAYGRLVSKPGAAAAIFGAARTAIRDGVGAVIGLADEVDPNAATFTANYVLGESNPLSEEAQLTSAIYVLGNYLNIYIPHLYLHAKPAERACRPSWETI